MFTALKRARYAKLLLVAGATVLIDQVTKEIVTRTIALHRSIDVIEGCFALTHIRNRGGAFGFLAGGGPWAGTFFFPAVSVMAIVMVLFLYMRIGSSKPWTTTALALIFGGALGNLVDRLRFGEVVDFLDFYIGTAHWPAFNVADSAITIGIGIFVFHLLFKKMPG